MATTPTPPQPAGRPPAPSLWRADPAARRALSVDVLGREFPLPAAVLSPASTDEVSESFRLCRDAGVVVVPQGGNTGLVGGGMPPHDRSAVVSTKRLVATDEVDRAAGVIAVGAGTTLADVQRQAGRHGLMVPADLASRDSATIGGMVATNAGGILSSRHGRFGTMVARVTVVTADGAVHEGGDELVRLVAGAEGTAGIVTKVWVRLVRAPASAHLLMLTCDLSAAGAVAAHMAAIPDVSAVEAMFQPAAGLVADHLGVALPNRDAEVHLLVECHDEATVEMIDAASANLGARIVTRAQDAADRRRMWALRERLPEAIRTLGVPAKLDAELPLDALPAAIGALRTVVPGVIPFGHLARGNVHLNIPRGGAAGLLAAARVVADAGGGLNAEHGWGVDKRGLLGLVPDDVPETVPRREWRSRHDPDALLNPHLVGPGLRDGHGR